MSYIPGDTVYCSLPVQSSTGAAVAADSLPTAVLVRNDAIDGAVAVTISVRDVGDYAVSAVIPVGYVAGNTIQINATVTLGGVVAPPVTVFHAVLDSKRVGSLNDAAAAPTTGQINSAIVAGQAGIDAAAAKASAAAVQAKLPAADALIGDATIANQTTINNNVGGVPAAVWAVGARTLTSYGTLAADTATAVWGVGTRSLTTFGSLTTTTATAVWAATGRTLSLAPPTASQIATAVWGYGERTLSSFGTLASTIATAVWIALNRTLSTSPPTAQQIRTEMEGVGTKLTTIHSKLPTGNIGDATAASQTSIASAITGIPAAIVLAMQAVGTYLAQIFGKMPSGNVAAENTLTAMKGTGWADETLKDIKDAIDGIEVGDEGAGETPYDPLLTEDGEEAGTPVEDADVWITTDELGKVVYAGKLQTDATGHCIRPDGLTYGFMLDRTQHYYVWAQKAGWNGVTGIEIEWDDDEEEWVPS